VWLGPVVPRAVLLGAISWVESVAEQRHDVTGRAARGRRLGADAILVGGVLCWLSNQPGLGARVTVVVVVAGVCSGTFSG
jgi:hypothetical protein